MEKRTTTNQSGTVTALFKDRGKAECAFNTLSKRGYEKDDVDVIMSDETRQRDFSEGSAKDKNYDTKALEGVGVGSAIGGTSGAVIAAIAAIGTSIALPGLGLIVAGPLAAALVGAGAGGLTGGLIGALLGYGIPEDHAADFEKGIKEGGVVFSLKPKTAEDAAYFQREWQSCGGERIHSTMGDESNLRADEKANRQTAKGQVTIPVIEEELQVGKRQVVTGGVRVTTHVEEIPVEEEIRLRQEQVNVARRPVDRPLTETDRAALAGGTIEVRERAEVPVVNKQERVVEEVIIGKDLKESTETVRDTVRRTEVELEDLKASQAMRAAK